MNPASNAPAKRKRKRKASESLAEQAERIWPILVLSARHQQILSYSMLERLTGISAHLQANPFRRILRFCKDHTYPKLTAIVVNEEKGVPGILYPVDESPFADQCRVFVFDWLKIEPTPSADDFTKD